MFRKLIVLVCSVLLVAQANAQMGAAQKVQWDVDSSRNFSVPALAIWDAIKDPAKWAEISNGNIQSVTVSMVGNQQTRAVKFADGTERNDIVTQHQPEHKMIVLKLAAPFPEGISDGTIAFFVRSDDNGKGLLHICARVDGSKSGKEKIIASLRKEVSGYLNGLLTKLNGN